MVKSNVDILEFDSVNRKAVAEVPEAGIVNNPKPGTTPLEAKGRIFFNGSSYSGADIKVLVHRYDTGPEKAIQALNAAITTYGRVIDSLNKIKTVIAPFTLTMLEKFAAGQALLPDVDIARKQFFLEIKTISSLESSLNTQEGAGYYQGIAGELSASSANLAVDPQGMVAFIDKRLVTLTELILDWGSIKHGLENNPTGFVATKTLAELQTISISTDRDKRPVRSFGQVQVKGFVRGPRTIAGTMIFTVFDKHVLWEILGASHFDADNGFKPALIDQLPPIDITISFANEYGSLSRMTLYGVEFVNEGRTMSIENLLLEDVVQYVARDIDIMTPVLDSDGNSMSNRILHFNQSSFTSRFPHRIGQVKASDLLANGLDEPGGYQSTAQQRYKRRNNPFQ